VKGELYFYFCTLRDVCRRNINVQQNRIVGNRFELARTIPKNKTPSTFLSFSDNIIPQIKNCQSLNFSLLQNILLAKKTIRSYIMR